MTDWATISSMATAGATLVLAVGTFASVRSANKAARTAERALLAGLRPVLVPSRLEDPPDKIAWANNHWTRLTGGRASIELVDGHIYLAMSLRNVGSGIAVLQGWHPALEWNPGGSHAELDQFRRQGRDLFVAAGGLGFWQGAVRDSGDAAPFEPDRGHPGAAPVRHRAALQRPRRRPAHHQPVLGHAPGRARRPRAVAVLGGPPLEHRPAGPALGGCSAVTRRWR